MGEMHEDEPAMHEVVALRFEVVDRDVVLAKLDVRSLDVVEQPQIDVGRDDAAARGDRLAEPASDGPATGADLEASPSRADAHEVQAPLRQRVEGRLDVEKALGFEIPRDVLREVPLCL